MNYAYFLLIGTLILLGCKDNSSSNPSIETGRNEALHYTDVIDTSIITIIPLTSAAWMADADRQATLSFADFQQIELMIQAAVSGYNANMKKKHDELLAFYREEARFMGLPAPADFPIQDTIPAYSEYFRQYVPYYNTKNEKVVAIYFSCSAYGEWKTVLYQVQDGGNCYFDAILNLTTNLCERIMVNGNA